MEGEAKAAKARAGREGTCRQAVAPARGDRQAHGRAAAGGCAGAAGGDGRDPARDVGLADRCPAGDGRGRGTAAHLCHAPCRAHPARRRRATASARRLPARRRAPRSRCMPVPLQRTSISGRAMHRPRDDPSRRRRAAARYRVPGCARRTRRKTGLRAVLAVPLMREGEALAPSSSGAARPGLFAPDQVALVETFATQAAIAIENVRLFRATQEALEQQTATSEILRVISSSPTDVQPVFDDHRRQRAASVRRAPQRHLSIRWRTHPHRRALRT